MRIGIDFDNTIAGYAALFRRIAEEAGWLDPGFPGDKKDIRDRIRQHADGEARWMRMQAVAYGRRMAEACLIDGVAPFLTACGRDGHRVMIVSHKTRTAAADPDGVDLRQAALDWMEARRFFAADGFGLRREDVHFADTRAEKCRRIAALGCDLFIDDLEEVFLDPAFPPTVTRLLYHPGAGWPSGPFRVFRDWGSLARTVLGDG